MFRVIRGPVGIVFIAGLLGIVPSVVLVLLGVNDPRVVGPLLVVPVLTAAIATGVREWTDHSRDRVGWLYCGWILGERRAVGIDDLVSATRARGLGVAIPEGRVDGGYLFVAFAAAYLGRLVNLTLGGTPLMYGLELRGERIDHEGVTYVVYLSHQKLDGSLLGGQEIMVTLSRYALRQ